MAMTSVSFADAPPREVSARHRHYGLVEAPEERRFAFNDKRVADTT